MSGGQLDGNETGSRFDENVAVYFGEDYVESLHCNNTACSVGLRKIVNTLAGP